MGIRGIGNSVTLCSIMGLILVGVIFAISIPSAEAVDVPVFPTLGNVGNFNQWTPFGSPTNCNLVPLLQCALSDGSTATGIFSKFNNQKTTFKLNLPNLPTNVQI